MSLIWLIFTYATSQPVALIVGTLVCILSWYWLSVSWMAVGKNPMVKDSQVEARPYVDDQSKRDAVLKQRLTSKVNTEGFDIIVIGSGIGGLVCAATLAKSGKKILVLEQHDQAGGCCHSFHEKGYEFDTGLHYVGANPRDFLRFLLAQVSDGQIQWTQMDDIYDLVVIGDSEESTHVPMCSGRSNLIESLKSVFPSSEDHASIDRYFKLISSVAASSKGFISMKLLPKWLGSLLIKSGLVKVVFPFFKYTELSAKDVLASITTNEKLSAALLYLYGDYGTPPHEAPFALHALLVRHYMFGAYYPTGGSSEIAFHIIPVIERAGGRVLVNAHVESLIVENDHVVGVRMRKSDHVILAKECVISACSVASTQTILPEEHRPRLDVMMRHVTYNKSALVLYVGIKGSAKSHGLKAQNIWYVESADIEGDYSRYMSLTAEEASETKPPIMFVSFPSTKDTTWDNRIPEKCTLEILTLSKWEWFETWADERVKKRGDDYEKLKNAFGKKLWSELCKHLPELSNCEIEYFEVGTPLTNNYYINGHRGVIYGADHNLNRFSPEAALDLRPSTPMPGLYIAGQDVFLAGIVSAATGGFMAAGAVLKRNVLRDLLKIYKPWFKQNFVLKKTG